jgi:hypothetical protein
MPGNNSGSIVDSGVKAGAAGGACSANLPQWKLQAALVLLVLVFAYATIRYKRRQQEQAAAAAVQKKEAPKSSSSAN